MASEPLVPEIDTSAKKPSASETLPALRELRASGRWLRWRLEDHELEGKLLTDRKQPYNARTGYPASHSEPDDWSSYTDASTSTVEIKPISCCRKFHGVEGIGLVIGPPFLAVDLDDCRDPATGKVEEWAEAYIKDINSYTELSPSETGFHIWFRGTPPYPEGHHKDGVEIYSTKRYYTVTGRHVEGTPTELRQLSKEEVKRLYERVKSGRRSEVPPSSVQARRLSSRLQLFMEGRWEKAATGEATTDLSRAVHQFLILLGEETLCDEREVERIFTSSKTYSDTHWRGKWSRLRQSELDKALTKARENLRRKLRGAHGEPTATRSIKLTRADQVKREHLKFLWEPVLPHGSLVHFGGASSQGKSPVTVDIAARATRGTVWPNGQENSNGPKSVIILNLEDRWEDRLLPRFDLAGGDSQKLHLVKFTTLEKDSEVSEVMIALDQDVEALRKAAREIPDLGLIIIDPITNYLGRAKMNAEEEVRAVLTPLTTLAEDLKCTVVTVGHFNKGQSSDPLQRMMGAAAFVGVARSVYAFGPDRDSDNPYTHIMAPARGSVGDEAFKYRTEVVEMEWDGEKSGVIRVVWDGTSTATAEDTVMPESRKTKSDIKAAAADLRELLKKGKRAAKECIERLRENGYDVDHMNLVRVRKAAGADTDQKSGQWWWFLTATPDTQEPMFKAGAEEAVPF